jgi:hypothetical protein
MAVKMFLLAMRLRLLRLARQSLGQRFARENVIWQRSDLNITVTDVKNIRGAAVTETLNQYYNTSNVIL